MGTRERILIEAEREFGEQGYSGARVAGIASAVGLGNAGLLHHFPSKADLYRAVLDSIADALDGDDDSPVGDDGLDRVRSQIHRLVALHRERPEALAIIAREFLDRSGRIERATAMPLAGVVRDTVSALELGQRTGTVRPGDPLAMAAAMHGVVLVGLLGRIVYWETGTAGAERVDDAAAWEAELERSAIASVAAGG